MELVDEFKKELKEEEIQWIKKKKKKQRVIEVNLNSEAEEFKRGELLERYTAKILYEQNNKKFENEYLKKLKENQER